MYKKSAKITDLQKEKWEKTRSGGVMRYVLLHGILLSGTIYVIFTYFANIAIEVIWARWYDLPYEAPSESWGARVLSGLIFGVIIGLVDWTGREKKYLTS